MTPAARVSAAIEVLADIETRRRPASDALKDWGLARRFAGSKDRAAIASLVYDALRRKASAACLMGADTPRAVLIGTLRLMRGLDLAEIDALFSGERFAPEPLSEGERERLSKAGLADAPAAIAGDYPDWIEGSLRRAFGDDLVPEMQALASRAPLDLRANSLKASRDALKRELAHLNATETPHSAAGLRIWPGIDGKGPPVQAEPRFQEGWFEIQDEGSQLAAEFSEAKPGERIVDLCAGGGGKTLALSALMRNEGEIYATDQDLRRLAPIHERLRRAGVANAEVCTPRPGTDPLGNLKGSVDCVFVDAPCTGTGTWRRNPDAKWRLRPGSLAQRVHAQTNVLDRAAGLVRRGGRIVYVTCSVLPEENDDAIEAFLGRHSGFSLAALEPHDVPQRRTRFGEQLSPLRTGTDGFYLATLFRSD